MRIITQTTHLLSSRQFLMLKQDISKHYKENKHKYTQEISMVFVKQSLQIGGN